MHPSPEAAIGSVAEADRRAKLHSLPLEPQRVHMTTTFDDNDNRLANLISYKTGLDQQQTAGWAPGPPEHSGLGCHIHGEQLIPVSDGVSLAAEICTPK